MPRSNPKQPHRIEIPEREGRIWAIQKKIRAIDSLVLRRDRGLIDLMAAGNEQTTAEFLKSQTKTKAALVAELSRIHPKPKSGEAPIRSASRKGRGWNPVRFSLDDGPIIDSNALRLIAQTTGSVGQALTPPCADFTIGFAPVSDWFFYFVNLGSNGNIVYWPDGSYESFPAQSYAGDWSNTYTTRFWGAANSGDGLGIIEALVFKYSIPAPSCRSEIVWGAKAIVQASSSWLFDCGSGLGETEWVYHESPNGHDFPPWYNLIHDEHGILREGSRSGVTYDRPFDERVIEGGFLVEGGVSPNIYVGLSAWFEASGGGHVNTYEGGPADDYFSLPWGVFYMMAKANA